MSIRSRSLSACMDAGVRPRTSSPSRSDGASASASSRTATSITVTAEEPENLATRQRSKVARAAVVARRAALRRLSLILLLFNRGARSASLGKDDGIEKLRALAENGNAKALAIYERAGAILGRSVGDLVNVLSPQIVLVSGEGTDAWPHLDASFRKALRANLFPALSNVAVEVDPWDDAKWAIGAAALVLRATFTPLVDGSNDELSMRAWVRAEPPSAEVVA